MAYELGITKKLKDDPNRSINCTLVGYGGPYSTKMQKLHLYWPV